MYIIETIYLLCDMNYNISYTADSEHVVSAFD